MIDSGCKDCTERSLGCHSRCAKYAEYRKKIDMLNKFRRNEKIRDTLEMQRTINIANVHAKKQQARRISG